MFLQGLFKMNILFLTLIDFTSINEPGIYTDLMRQFSKNHKLFIVSPTENKANKKESYSDLDEVKIIKPYIGKVQKSNFIIKGINTILLESVIKKAIIKSFSNVKFDLIIYSTPPITLESCIRYVKSRDHAKAYLLLKDIFPQNAIDLNIISKSGIKGIIYNYFKYKEKRLYELSDFIGCMSRKNVDYLVNNDTYLEESKIEICPNSIEPINIKFTDSQKIEIRNKYGLPLDKKVFIYGGNLGKPQGIDYLIKCIKLNEIKHDSFFFIVGNGTEFIKLNDLFLTNEIKNSKLIKSVDRLEFDYILKACDVGLIFLDHRFTIPNYPSRILSYMQASLPIFAATDVNTDIKELIQNNQLGYWCSSSNLDEFDKNIDLCVSNANLEKLGLNSRIYLESNYTAKHSYEIIMNHFK